MIEANSTDNAYSRFSKWKPQVADKVNRLVRLDCIYPLLVNFGDLALLKITLAIWLKLALPI